MGIRTIIIDDGLLELLLAERTKHLRIIAGALTNAPVDLGLIKLPTDSLMFPSAWHGAIDLARPRDCRALSDMFTAKAKALGLPTRLHDLRVTHETMLLAILHTRRHRWRATPLDPLPWQMGVAPAFSWMLALVAEPGGHFDFDKLAALGRPALYRRFRRSGRNLGRRLRE
jgi:hypothetical protein